MINFFFNNFNFIYEIILNFLLAPRYLTTLKIKINENRKQINYISQNICHKGSL